MERGGVQDVHGGRYLCSPNSYGQTVTPLSKTCCFAPQSSSPLLLGDRPSFGVGGLGQGQGCGSGDGEGFACLTAVVIKSGMDLQTLLNSLEKS